MIVHVCGREVAVNGRLIVTAGLAADMYEFLEDPVPTIEHLRHCGKRIDLFTFVQRLPHTEPKYDYRWEWDNVAALPILSFDHWWSSQLDNKTRNMVRRAERKGISTVELPFDDALVRGVSAIYNESEIRQGKQFAHYGKSLDEVRAQLGTFLDRSTFIGALNGDRLVGFAKIILEQTQTQAGLVHLLSLFEHRDKAPNNALIAHAVRACAERHVPYLVYSRFSDRDKQHDSLIAFKQNNGFKRVDVPRYYVPLTSKGNVALRLQLHKRLTDHLPGWFVEEVRAIRTALRKRKCQSLPQTP